MATLSKSLWRNLSYSSTQNNFTVINPTPSLRQYFSATSLDNTLNVLSTLHHKNHAKNVDSSTLKISSECSSVLAISSDVKENISSTYTTSMLLSSNIKRNISSVYTTSIPLSESHHMQNNLLLYVGLPIGIVSLIVLVVLSVSINLF